jgi:hypothetical protein
MDKDLYRYQKLPNFAIRVLVLSAAQPEQPLQGRLETGWLPFASATPGKPAKSGSSACNYEAISYAWGSPVLDHCVATTSGNIMIPKSLDEALRHLRYDDRERRLWADAPCISQTDKKEKAIQVALMAEIFGSASQVLVWLGGSGPSDALSFATLSHENLLDEIVQSDDPRPSLDRALAEHSRCSCCGEAFGEVVDLGLSGLIAAKDLLSRSWFTRVWTLQEVSGPPHRVTICVGSHRASLKALRDAFHRLHDVQRLTDQRLITQQQFNRIAELYEVSDALLSDEQGFRPTEELISLVLTAANRQCSDPRDRLFAMKGIFNVRNKLNLRPDYQASVAEVYRRFVGYIFNFSGSEARAEGLDPDHHAACLLAISRTTFDVGGPTEDWPSWVPDFHRLTADSITTFNMYVANTYMDWTFHPVAWPFSRSSIRFNARNPLNKRRQLHVRGRVFGRVQSILRLKSQERIGLLQDQAAEVPAEDLIDEILSWYVNVCEFLQAHLQMENVHDSSWDSIARTILGAGIGYGETSEDRGKLFHAIKDRWYQLDIGKSEISLDSLYHRLLPLLVVRWAKYQDWSRHLCSIAISGLPAIIGWLPQTVSEDDSVCYFAGAPFPFVLRRMRIGVYKLLGHVWLHGLAEWQVLGMSEDEWRKYARVDARFKSRSRWWEDEVVDLDDVNRQDELSLELWDKRNLDNIVLY